MVRRTSETMMDEGPVVLGLNRTHGASACWLHGSRLVWASQKERFTRQKHHWGRHGDVRGLYRALAMPPFWIRKRIEPERPE